MKKIQLFLFVLLFAFTANAQKVVLMEGDLAPLKGQKMILLKFNYDSMGVGKYVTEQEYIDYKVDEYKKKDPAKADKWLDGWKSNRATRFEPKFETLINKGLKNGPHIYPVNKDAKYTLIVMTTYTEPGFNVGVVRKSASIDVEYVFVETADPKKVVARMYSRKIPGRDVSGYDFDAGVRIEEAYALAGKSLAKYLAKALK